MESNNYLKGIVKFNIKLKSKPKDGVVLQLHHTVRGPNGTCRRIRFLAAAFDDTYEKVACADSGGNIFILDFRDLKYWKLSGIGPCTAVHFEPCLPETLVVATTNDYTIYILNTESSKRYRTLYGHTATIKHISFSNSKTRYLLTASAAEAILWELRNYTKYFTLNTYLGAQIQQILFTPSGDYLVSCFQNDTVQIWKNETMKSVKQIIPNELKNMKTIAFTTNGRAMAMAGLAPILILFNMDTWQAHKSIDLTKYDISGAQQIAFIPQVFDGGANRILAILSNDCSLYLLDAELLKIVYKITPVSSGIKKIVVSPTGKYFSCILKLGEVNIYKTSHVMELANNKIDLAANEPKPSPSCCTCDTIEKKKIPSKTDLELKMSSCMDGARLRRILLQYGEYPDKYRSIIWRSLLNTPKNKVAYAALVNKGIHESYKDIEKYFSIHSHGTLKNLKRLLSCLAHWCPLFAVIKYLPAFTFPFVKVLQKDPHLLYEAVATVLLNYCQLWFEYAPLPPISILTMVENILAEHDKDLLDHLCKVGVTSQVYALKILETAFSEVLTCGEWLILWDHILSNEPAYILMVAVSYNIVQRNVLKKLKTIDQIEKMYHSQNPIEMKTFLKKSYNMLNSTSEDIHPRKFFNNFTPLEKGDTYQQFTGYPKATISLKLSKKSPHKFKEVQSLKKLILESQSKEIESRCSRPLEESSDETDELAKSNSSSQKCHNKTVKGNNFSDKGDYVNIKYKTHSKLRATKKSCTSKSRK